MFQFLTKTKNYTKKKENMEYSQGKKNQKFQILEVLVKDVKSITLCIRLLKTNKMKTLYDKELKEIREQCQRRVRNYGKVPNRNSGA